MGTVCEEQTHFPVADIQIDVTQLANFEVRLDYFATVLTPE